MWTEFFGRPPFTALHRIDTEPEEEFVYGQSGSDRGRTKPEDARAIGTRNPAVIRKIGPLPAPLLTSPPASLPRFA